MVESARCSHCCAWRKAPGCSQRVQESMIRKAADAIEEVFGGSATEGDAGDLSAGTLAPFGGNEARRERLPAFPQVASAWEDGRADEGDGLENR